MSKAKQALQAIRDLPDGELAESATKARDELFRLKLSSYTNQVQDTASIRTKRRELARILTIANGRKAGTQVQGDVAPKAAAPKAEKVAAPKAPKPVHKPKAKAEASAPKAEKPAKAKAAATKDAPAKKKTAKKKED